jgi:hypothetical protein
MQLLSMLLLVLQAILAFLVLLLQMLLYFLQLALSTLLNVTNKLLTFFPALRELSDYLLNTSGGRLLREFFSLFVKKTHRLEAKFVWHNFLEKLKE